MPRGMKIPHRGQQKTAQYPSAIHHLAWKAKTNGQVSLQSCELISELWGADLEEVKSDVSALAEHLWRYYRRNSLVCQKIDEGLSMVRANRFAEEEMSKLVFPPVVFI